MKVFLERLWATTLFRGSHLVRVQPTVDVLGWDKNVIDSEPNTQALWIRDVSRPTPARTHVLCMAVTGEAHKSTLGI